jgi:hypothetical protein
MPRIGSAPEARLPFIKRSIELPSDLNSGPFYYWRVASSQCGSAPILRHSEVR